ncbi:interleukin-23 receptor isoform X2 [Hippoglossus hippoglossus]|uniref:interleukin-23 receptor isoform X2 n=1 Tax=Hippoglossus hippoglossus TaxID=8267 RepID=UPI00148C6F2C|nr:interleukin-23 receptor isoform X2 [Hippoglossus hippoglossus]
MNLSSSIWRCIIILLNFSLQRSPLLGCLSYRELGYLTVEPVFLIGSMRKKVFLIGSNLTVYCHIHICEKSYERFKISLDLNNKTVKDWKEVNCSTVIFNLTNVRIPRSYVLCKLKSRHVTKIVSGLDLHGGLPPHKPGDVTCETTRASAFIDCSWKRGAETYLSTTYNVSVYRENGAQVQWLNQTQDAEEITIPRGIVNGNTKYQLIITAYNHFGASQSDPFILCEKDIVIPDTPHILHIEFENSSTAAVLKWNTSDFSVTLRSYIRLLTHRGSWEARETTELSEGLIRADDLRPLTEYEFQIRTCNSTSGLTTSSKRPSCSRWSSSVTGRSPGKGPSQQLHVWRTFSSQLMVIVLWKPPHPDDYSGVVQEYKIFFDQKEGATCPKTSSQRSVMVPAEVQALSVSAVTSYGSTPAADVPLTHSGVFGPVLRELAPAANGRAVLVSWSWPGTKHWSTSGGELRHYVVEWISVPATQLQWNKLDKDQNSTSITGLTAGVRYNISVYAVTTGGVSAPSSGLVYSKEQRPVSGPILLVLVHESRRILIQWDKLPVDQRRGFVTNYTLYVQSLDSNRTTLRVVVSGSGPRQMWLDCPDGTLALQLTASTSAGEGPRGSQIVSQPAAPVAGLVIVIVFIITFFIAITANLMCWSCVRERIKQRCISWGPAWLVENLPKPENSNAIRLLEDRGELSFVSSDSDPLLSPISMISWEERDNVYPAIHVEGFHFGLGQTTAETPSLPSDTGTMLVERQMEHVSYKPHIAILEVEEEPKYIPANVEEEVCLSEIGGLLGGLLSSVEMDFSDSPLEPTLSSVGGILRPKTPEATDVLSRGFSTGRRGTESEAEVDCPSLKLHQGDVQTPDMADTCLSQNTAEMMLSGGYFPQVTTLCDT